MSFWTDCTLPQALYAVARQLLQDRQRTYDVTLTLSVTIVAIEKQIPLSIPSVCL